MIFFSKKKKKNNKTNQPQNAFLLYKYKTNKFVFFLNFILDDNDFNFS